MEKTQYAVRHQTEGMRVGEINMNKSERENELFLACAMIRFASRAKSVWVAVSMSYSIGPALIKMRVMCE